MTSPNPHALLFVHLPGLLARAALEARRQDDRHVPLVLAQGRLVRDASPRARGRGIADGQSVLAARRRCPTLLVVPLDQVDARKHSAALWNALAQWSPVVEPAGPDAAFAALPLSDMVAVREDLERRFAGLSPCIGIGRSKLAARAAAMAGRLDDAPVEMLFPADPAVAGKLVRLGLSTFGEVAALPLSALVYAFGRKTGTLLSRRARGIDDDPVRPLWPLPEIRLARDFTLDPLVERGCLEREMVRLCQRAARELASLGRFTRRMTLQIVTERGRVGREWRPPLPLQEESGLCRACLRLLSLLPLDAPVTAVTLHLDEIDLPAARSLSLFEAVGARETARLESAKRLLVAHYGPQALTTAGRLPVALRDRRRALVRGMQ